MMKFFLFFLFFFKIGQSIAQEYSIEKNIIGVMLDSNYAKAKVYLCQLGVVKLDSIICENGKFEFCLKKDDFPRFFIQILGKDSSIYTVANFVFDYKEPVYIEIIDLENKKYYSSSSLYNSKWDSYSKQISTIREKYSFKKFKNAEDSLKAKNDTETKIYETLEELQQKNQFFFLSIFRYHLNTIKLLEPSPSFLTKVSLLLNKIDSKYLNNSSFLELEKYVSSNKTSLLGHFIENYSFPTCNNDSIKTIEFKNKKYILLNFWATWCGPCKPKNEYIETNIKKYQSAGIEVIGVLIDNNNNEKNDDQIKMLCSKVNFSWTQGLLGKNIMSEKIMDNFRIETVPKVFLISKEGKIIDIYIFKFEDVIKIIKEYENEKR